ncbi:FMN-binding negative transcriptional regulator [Modestobacter sp. SYSU DS0657]
MYVPAAFAARDDAVAALLAAPGAVDLVGATPAGLTATTLPMVHDPASGTLRGHLARNNPQWRETVGEVLVIVRGPDAYVSPSWCAAKAEHGRVVPTWDHVVAPERFVAGQLRSVVGVEVRIARVEARWKLSQNRSPADVDGVVAGLRADGARATADAVAAARPGDRG